MALWIEAQSSLSGFFSEFGYLAPFTILLLCGFGLPIPEEVTMLGSGFLLYQGRVEAVPIIAVCFVATLLGDSVPYFLGRRYGRQALRIRSVRRLLNPARIRAMERRFRTGGVKTIFACRFIPGLRLPAWFTAGTMGMPYPRFLLVDGLGAALMTPFFVLLGRASGEKIAELESSVENLTQILGFVVVSLAAIMAIHVLIIRRLPSSNRTGPDAQSGPRSGAGKPPLGRLDSAGATGQDGNGAEDQDEDLADGDRP